jgi:hypothetical protein
MTSVVNVTLPPETQLCLDDQRCNGDGLFVDDGMQNISPFQYFFPTHIL